MGRGCRVIQQPGRGILFGGECFNPDSYSALAAAFYAARRIDLASGLDRLIHLGESEAVTGLAFSF